MGHPIPIDTSSHIRVIVLKRIASRKDLQIANNSMVPQSLCFRNKSRKKILTAQFGIRASIVGERPRYIPLKPSVLIMSFRLEIMILPVGAKLNNLLNYNKCNYYIDVMVHIHIRKCHQPNYVMHIKFI